MKVCYIPWILESLDSFKKADEVIPMGLLILTEILVKNGHEAQIYNVNKRINDLEYSLGDDRLFSILAEEVLETNADIYGISTIVEGFQYQMQLANYIKKINPNVTLVLGGPQATVYSEEILNNFSFIDYILCGESELSILSFMDMIAGQVMQSDVLGLCFRNNENVIFNQEAPILKNLDELPFVNYDNMNLETLESIPIEVGRGCPFSCSFCSSSTFFKREYRLKTTDRLISEIEYLMKKYKKNKFGFIHDLFTLNKDYVLEICRKISEKNLDIRWSCSARADKLDFEMIDRMKDAGCVGLFFGIESGSDFMQKAMNKNLKIGEALKNIDYAKSKNINIMASFVYGFPQENYENLLDTLKLRNLLLKKGIQSANPKVLRPIKGSPIYNEFEVAPFNKLLCLHRLDKTNYNKFVENMMTKYPDIFSYYRVYLTNYLTINTLAALAIIISSEDFIISQTLLVELDDFDFILFLKSFDLLDTKALIFDYEKHYLKYLKNIEENNNVRKILHIAKFEKNKLDFIRNVNENHCKYLIEVKEYLFPVNIIRSVEDISILDKIDEKKVYYLFYYSLLEIKVHILEISKQIFYFIKKHIENKSNLEIERVLSQDGIIGIEVLEKIKNDFMIQTVN